MTSFSTLFVINISKSFIHEFFSIFFSQRSEISLDLFTLAQFVRHWSFRHPRKKFKKAKSANASPCRLSTQQCPSIFLVARIFVLLHGYLAIFFKLFQLCSAVPGSPFRPACLAYQFALNLHVYYVNTVPLILRKSPKTNYTIS